MKVDIFGSCITRDAFEIESNDIEVGNYFSRSSLVSAVHYPREIKEKINLEHRFLNRSIEQDVTKRFQKYSKNPKSKVLVIDLIQERYSLNFLERSLSTYSPEYVRAKLPKGRLISGKEHLEIFTRYLRKIVRLLSKYELVIIHEANLIDRYKDENNNDVPIKLTQKDKFFIEYGNQYYNLLKENLPSVESIKIGGFYGDPNHKWGMSPSHYETGYYEEFTKQLKTIIKKHNLV